MRQAGGFCRKSPPELQYVCVCLSTADVLRDSMITSVVTFLNYLLSRTETSVTYWSDAYLPSVFSKFPELDSAARLRLQPWELLAATSTTVA